MRYALFVQGFDQLEEKYSKVIANTIKGNCQTWAYLQSDDPETLRAVSYTHLTLPTILRV